MNPIKKYIFLIILILSINCASSNAGLVTSNIPIVNKKYKVIAPVEKTKIWNVFDIGIIATTFSTPPINEMINEMLKEKEADALINIRYWQDRSIIFCITRHRLNITAEAIQFEKEEVNATPKKTK
jgi:hypothetical protein